MPPNVDWSEPEQQNLAADGIYTFEIEAAEMKTSKVSGLEYMLLRMRCVDDRSVSVFDNLSFSPKAKGILQAKLRALDMDGIESVEPDMFPGRRVKAAIKRDRGTDNVERMVVDISAKDSKAGYFPVSENGSVKKDHFANFDNDVSF
jgi:hypothetical protein